MNSISSAYRDAGDPVRVEECSLRLAVLTDWLGEMQQPLSCGETPETATAFEQDPCLTITLSMFILSKIHFICTRGKLGQAQGIDSMSLNIQHQVYTALQFIDSQSKDVL